MRRNYVLRGIKMPDTGACQRIIASNDSTIAIEAVQSGLYRKRKLVLFFESFTGDFCYLPGSPQSSRLQLVVDASSVVCRDRTLSSAKQRRAEAFAREVALASAQHPKIVFRSTSVVEKPLRGFVVRGDLTVRGITRAAKANLGVTEMKNDRLQIDADMTVRLKDFSINPPSSLFSLVRVNEEVMVHLLLWTSPSGASAS